MLKHGVFHTQHNILTDTIIERCFFSLSDSLQGLPVALWLLLFAGFVRFFAWSIDMTMSCFFPLGESKLETNELVLECDYVEPSMLRFVGQRDFSLLFPLVMFWPLQCKILKQCTWNLVCFWDSWQAQSSKSSPWPTSNAMIKLFISQKNLTRNDFPTQNKRQEKNRKGKTCHQHALVDTTTLRGWKIRWRDCYVLWFQAIWPSWMVRVVPSIAPWNPKNGMRGPEGNFVLGGIYIMDHHGRCETGCLVSWICFLIFNGFIYIYRGFDFFKICLGTSGISMDFRDGSYHKMVKT